MSQPVTLREAKKAWQKGLFQPITVSDATFTAGQDDGVTVAAGDSAEVARARVGEDGTLKQYSAVVWGQPAKGNEETVAGKPTVDLQNSTPADLPADAQFAFGGKKEGGRGKAISTWITEDDYHSVAKEKREPVNPMTPFILYNQFATIMSKVEGSTHSPSFSDSTLNLKLMAWNGEGL